MRQQYSCYKWFHRHDYDSESDHHCYFVRHFVTPGSIGMECQHTVIPKRVYSLEVAVHRISLDDSFPV